MDIDRQTTTAALRTIAMPSDTNPNGDIRLLPLTQKAIPDPLSRPLPILMQTR